MEGCVYILLRSYSELIDACVCGGRDIKSPLIYLS